jgi:hypothetical protein
MGPHRLIHNRKRYLTETAFDSASGRFVEVPWPPAARAPSITAEDQERVGCPARPGLHSHRAGAEE